MSVEQDIISAPILTGTDYQFGVGVGVESSTPFSAGTSTSSANVLWFKMRGIDANAATSPPTYRSWDAKDTPDYNASRFAGPFTGGSPNIIAVTVQAEFSIPTQT